MMFTGGGGGGFGATFSGFKFSFTRFLRLRVSGSPVFWKSVKKIFNFKI